MTPYLKNNVWLAVLTGAIAVGLLYAGPQFFAKRSAEKLGYQYIAPQFLMLADGGDAYFQFAHNLASGHFPPGDLSTDQNLPNIFPWLPPVLLGALIAIAKNVSLAYLWAQLVFSAALFAMFYWLGLLIFEKNRLWSFFLGLIGTLTPMAIHSVTMLLSFQNFLDIAVKDFYPLVKSYQQNLFLARVDYPLLTHLIYLPAIAFLLAFWQKPDRLKAVLTGLFAGLLFYTYFHKWVYWVIALGLLFGYTLIFLRKDRARVKNFAILIGTTALVSIPYFLNYFRLKQLPGYQDFVLRLGLEVGRAFNWSAWPYYLVYLALGVIVYFAIYKKDKLTGALFFAFLAAAVIIWNIQIVIGYVPHSDHWPRAINPLMFVIIFYLVYRWVKNYETRRPRARRVAAAALVLLMALLIAKKIVNAAGFIDLPNNRVITTYTLPKDLLDSYQWLDAAHPGARIISPSFITSIYLSGLTSARPILPWASVSQISNKEFEDIFLTANKLFGVPPEVLQQRLRGFRAPCIGYCQYSFGNVNIAESPVYLYGAYFSQYHYVIPEKKNQELLVRYSRLQARWSDLRPIADYAYYGPLEKQFKGKNFDSDPQLAPAYRAGGVAIYKIK